VLCVCVCVCAGGKEDKSSRLRMWTECSASQPRGPRKNINSGPGRITALCVCVCVCVCVSLCVPFEYSHRRMVLIVPRLMGLQLSSGECLCIHLRFTLSYN